ncbi:hypothetical protein SAMN05192561_10496 [Halopenitus malekzadehii]|uniref:Phospholipase_D-nuclease N-terminal n=1 Tax=Halopenitus malekzadehii TaxID=1267564 RepID=A0A1H6IS53_9EURY|nr:hypothetical protein [Halopenitus malekzadehii]SEH52102.1 hypothetical protein SAMN05192561_10496 [Halopenitus malekzadehii]
MAPPAASDLLVTVVPLAVDLATVRSLVYYGAIYGVVLAVAVWIYRDARDRGIGYPAVWAVATLVLTIVPVLAYLYVRGQRTREHATEPADRDP